MFPSCCTQELAQRAELLARARSEANVAPPSGHLSGSAGLPEGGTLQGDSPTAPDGEKVLGAGQELAPACIPGLQQGTVQAEAQAAAPPQAAARHMGLEEAAELLQAEERGRQARERVAALQAARAREGARKSLCKDGKVAHQGHTRLHHRCSRPTEQSRGFRVHSQPLQCVEGPIMTRMCSLDSGKNVINILDGDMCLMTHVTS